MYMHVPIRPLLGLLLLGISPTIVADDAADRAAIEAAAQAWIRAFNAHDADAMTALATEDVVVIDPSAAPIGGRNATRLAWQQAFGVGKGQVATASKEVVIAGDVAWRIGALTHRLPTGEVVNRGQSLEIWKRVNGKWRIHRQMPAALLAQPKPRPVPSEPILDAPRN